MDGQAQFDISKLSDSDRNELNQFLQNETQKSTIQQTVHHLSEVCFKKCITGNISSNRLDRTEELCAQNCVDRWMDANLSILKHLETLRGGQ
ncbi:magnesium and cobalt transport protein and translocase of inner mitochondrial membrane, putative [Talaromyces stipitatus ATCC 10500]|uniref:Mitochondrial import inner membrane translocase subunit n=1 Tax=Talaromyces stipitatus (strain ATCC 10500 / CBS 375.48 / QM 6759 / NRRL 1006) TaxID=441959 RepID=B8MBZ1_TALSN|nr:magnesium and cobalt transport protein and translocase of inner mitochondrial membrane, putative [Talaromyces stipitatus ATCC 10500]EED18437.1 magnesium and cobalt transport protein and translocase of inner mitochondrial membrane, putative [Talaromyces stipitatus ATCC 10500]